MPQLDEIWYRLWFTGILSCNEKIVCTCQFNISSLFLSCISLYDCEMSTYIKGLGVHSANPFWFQLQSEAEGLRFWGCFLCSSQAEVRRLFFWIFFWQAYYSLHSIFTCLSTNFGIDLGWQGNSLLTWFFCHLLKNLILCKLKFPAFTN